MQGSGLFVTKTMSSQTQGHDGFKTQQLLFNAPPSGQAGNLRLTLESGRKIQELSCPGGTEFLVRFSAMDLQSQAIPLCLMLLTNCPANFQSQGALLRSCQLSLRIPVSHCPHQHQHIPSTPLEGCPR